jgi:hypothetical protein
MTIARASLVSAVESKLATKGRIKTPFIPIRGVQLSFIRSYDVRIYV